ncbi:MAG TPA: hypothetical protein VI566_13700 [Xanthomonadales bacterium]|nr:hypothetical protein [Xanthomonadales bacterium]
MNKMMRNLLAAALVVGMSPITAQESETGTAEAAKTEAAAEPTTGAVVTNEGWAVHCILRMVVTAVDGVAVTEGQAVDRMEFEPGAHTVSGYASDDDRSPCVTFSGEKAVVVAEGERIGESTATVNVVAGKEYFLGVDVRSADKKAWKIVPWKINH